MCLTSTIRMIHMISGGLAHAKLIRMIYMISGGLAHAKLIRLALFHSTVTLMHSKRMAHRCYQYYVLKCVTSVGKDGLTRLLESWVCISCLTHTVHISYTHTHLVFPHSHFLFPHSHFLFPHSHFVFPHSHFLFSSCPCLLPLLSFFLPRTEFFTSTIPNSTQPTYRADIDTWISHNFSAAKSVVLTWLLTLAVLEQQDHYIQHSFSCPVNATRSFMSGQCIHEMTIFRK